MRTDKLKISEQPTATIKVSDKTNNDRRPAQAASAVITIAEKIRQ